MPNKITTIKRIRVLGDFMMFGIFICLLIIFLNAYLNGVFNGTYQTMVDINSKNEAHIEMFILIVVLFPIFIMTTLWSFLDWKATWKARDNIRFQQYFFETDNSRTAISETLLMRCSACNEMFGVTGVENEMTIECPHCNKTGMVKLPPASKRGDFGKPRAPEYRPGPAPDSGEGTGDSSELQVRIIKSIRNQ